MSKMRSSDKYSERSFNTVRNHHRMLIDGFSNFADESLPDFSEFDSDSIILEYVKERYTMNVFLIFKVFL